MTLSASEQLLIEMINRARLDPAGEAARFGIDLNEGLAPGTLDGSARQALSPNQLLHDAAESHSQWMIDADVFSHTGEGGSSPTDRMRDAGYQFIGSSSSGENIAYRGSTGTVDLDVLMEDHHHRDLFLSADHRVNMLRDFFREVGVSQDAGTFTAGGQNFNVGMVTENFASSGRSVFVTGVSYTDRDNDTFYSVGEGRAGVTVQAAGQTVQTQAAGGYGIKVAASADMAVTLGGISLRVDLSSGNGKLDLVGADVLTSVDTILTSAAGSLTALGVGDINLTGHAGADVLVGNAGDNVLDGGAGVDTVRYDLTRAQATLTQATDGAIVVTSAQGTDTLRNVEAVQFTDGGPVNLASLFGPALAPGDLAYDGAVLIGDAGADTLYSGGFAAGYAPEAAEQMFRLYQAAFDRVPDVAGHENWAQYLFENRGTLTDVAAAFVASNEFQNTYGNLSTGAFVDLLYQNVLGRAADADGRANWIAHMDDAGNSRADTLKGFSESREFTNNVQVDATSFTERRTPGDWSDDIFRLYTAALGRAPDKGGFDNWTNVLTDGLDFSEAVAGFVGSREFNQRYGNPSNDGFVELMYQNVLNRDPDAAGRENWLNYMESGNSRAAVVEAFAQSREFVNNTTPDVKAWVKAQGVDDVLMGGGGDNVLAGGALSDVFIFDAAHDSTNRVLDLETWDVLRFDGFGYASENFARSHFQQNGTDLVFADQGVSITFEDMTLGMISNDMLIV